MITYVELSVRYSILHSLSSYQVQACSQGWVTRGLACFMRGEIGGGFAPEISADRLDWIETLRSFVGSSVIILETQSRLLGRTNI